MNRLTVDGLGKRYYIGKEQRKEEKFVNLGFRKVAVPRAPWSRLQRGRELWALRHVSFAVPPGTILGIVGSNGAGKSTLLKVIAKVTRPTEGRVVGHGRVVSLLELGAGFNQDFSARENIYMNAAMHGISRAEVARKLDEIVAFAEVEKFLDSQIRHYSSGMYLRLAFSVAINMNPSILLADEILAVGDIAFQERCLQRVQEEAQRTGLTVLFVSHDMTAISRICDRVLWLQAGEIAKLGDAGEVVGDYQDAALGRGAAAPALDLERQGAHVNRQAEIVSVRLVSGDGRVLGAAPVSEALSIRVRVKVARPDVAIRCLLDVHAKNVLVFKAAQPEEFTPGRKGTFDIHMKIPAQFLSETMYTVHVNVTTRNGKLGTVAMPNALNFMVYGSDDQTLYKGGLINPRLEWAVNDADVNPGGSDTPDDVEPAAVTADSE
ncbi:MAG TPA: polysaccharide ABC transporter ATP-binding protein [Vicinamibacterales bacterium]|nr:polysaccharide ABC transporter ATP-binding protein [Vicinamibacterales bacterium]